jgi:hypothetical protein
VSGVLCFKEEESRVSSPSTVYMLVEKAKEEKPIRDFYFNNTQSPVSEKTKAQSSVI